MSGQQNNSSNQLSLLKPYDIPVLRQGKEGYISFNTFDPAADKMRRKKIKVNHIKKSERKFTPEYKFYSLKDTRHNQHVAQVRHDNGARPGAAFRHIDDGHIYAARFAGGQRADKKP